MPLFSFEREPCANLYYTLILPLWCVMGMCVCLCVCVHARQITSSDHKPVHATFTVKLTPEVREERPRGHQSNAVLLAACCSGKIVNRRFSPVVRRSVARAHSLLFYVFEVGAAPVDQH